MIAYIQGELVKKHPTHVIIDAAGIGYHIHISLYTYSALPEAGELNVRLFTVLIIKEDSHTLYGFATEAERSLFQHLVSVSGIGPSTGRMILSSMNPDEIQQAIINGDVPQMQKIKGIGTKSAQRIILELQDKLLKGGSEALFSVRTHNTAREEALIALVTLGFAKNVAEKALEKVAATPGSAAYAVDIIIKLALKNL